MLNPTKISFAALAVVMASVATPAMAQEAKKQPPTVAELRAFYDKAQQESAGSIKAETEKRDRQNKICDAFDKACQADTRESAEIQQNLVDGLEGLKTVALGLIDARRDSIEAEKDGVVPRLKLKADSLIRYVEKLKAEIAKGTNKDANAWMDEKEFARLEHLVRGAKRLVAELGNVPSEEKQAEIGKLVEAGIVNLEKLRASAENEKIRLEGVNAEIRTAEENLELKRQVALEKSLAREIASLKTGIEELQQIGARLVGRHIAVAEQIEQKKLVEESTLTVGADEVRKLSQSAEKLVQAANTAIAR